MLTSNGFYVDKGIMVIYSYVIVRDFGFAPNPFFGHCTLATCKPMIRQNAQIGDWVIGTGSAAKNGKFNNRLVYAMYVEEKLTFDDYWNDARFFNKRPVMNGSNMQLYGDNIYHIDSNTGKFVQENSHHSLENGAMNMINYKRDLSSKLVLISKTYWYFGEEAILIPDKLKGIIKSGRGYRKIDDSTIIKTFVVLMQKQKGYAFIGKPARFSGEFVRFKGE
jgi:hypothetical protein